MRSIVRRTRIIAGFAILVMLPLSVLAKDKTDKRKITDQEQRLSDYSQRARQAAPVQPATVGSLWASGGLMTNMAADYKARNVNDLITIRISEATTATAQASVKTARTFNASSGVSAALGSLSTTNRLQNIFSPNSSQNLTGSGQTASTSALQTSLGGHVVDVLPNGVLVVQAEREIEMNNERQTVILRGLVRPGDIAPDNSVPSTSLANLEVELKGKGVISDGTRPPNRVVRAILWLVGF